MVGSYTRYTALGKIQHRAEHTTQNSIFIMPITVINYAFDLNVMLTC